MMNTLREEWCFYSGGISWGLFSSGGTSWTHWGAISTGDPVQVSFFSESLTA